MIITIVTKYRVPEMIVDHAFTHYKINYAQLQKLIEIEQISQSNCEDWKFMEGRFAFWADTFLNN